jgi:hypothetical protein
MQLDTYGGKPNMPAVAPGQPGRPMLRRRVTQAAALAVACLIAFLAFVAGEHQQRPPTVLRGIASAGDHVASVTVAGWVYGIDGLQEWIDRQGVTHEGGWPDCLSTPGRAVPITFGEIPVTAPDGSSWRQVVWVDCRS